MQLGSLQYPHNPMKGPRSTSTPLGSCGDLQRHGAQHRHRPRGLPAPQLHGGLPDRARTENPLSGVSTRSGNLALFTFKALDGAMTDVFTHLIAYQLVSSLALESLCWTSKD